MNAAHARPHYENQRPAGGNNKSIAAITPEMTTETTAETTARQTGSRHQRKRSAAITREALERP
ncbi:hypothetical protein OHS81_03880 [Streptomyces sp. NBC_00400]|uniref:hypothetical protein n=1 Tax=Streptomyces sp. NBC_00400 TaxID=2975737 RepID=UPI002E1F0F7D